MREPVLKIYPDAASLFLAAAGTITGLLDGALAKRSRANLVLAGGGTPREVYRSLAARDRSPAWRQIGLFWGDERCVPPASAESNFRMVQETLLLRAEVPPENIHRIRGELEDSEQAARLYEDEIRRSFPGTELPRFDLVLLGMGEDGHTASLFPGARWDEDRWVVASRAPSPSYRRISMTPRILNGAKHLIFIVSGQAKAAALRKVLEDPSCDCPAGRIRPSAGSLLWMVDQTAASTLSH